MTVDKGNIFAEIPADLPEELTQCLVSGKHFKIERIVSEGHATPVDEWYDQAWHEWVILLQGEAILRYEDGLMLKLKAGDFVNIPAHCRHRVDWTLPGAESIWLAVHFDEHILVDFSGES